MRAFSRAIVTHLLAPALALAGTNALASQGSISFSTDFESGSIGTIRKLDNSGRAFDLSLRDDNNDASLPDSFRTWWYVRAANLPLRR